MTTQHSEGQLQPMGEERLAELDALPDTLDGRMIRQLIAEVRRLRAERDTLRDALASRDEALAWYRAWAEDALRCVRQAEPIPPVQWNLLGELRAGDIITNVQVAL